MRRRLILGVAFLVVLGIGIGIGSSGKSNASATTSTETTTVTTMTTTSKAAATPAACHHAISDARGMAGLASQGFGIASKWPQLLIRVAKAAEAQNAAGIDSVVTSEKSLNQRATILAAAMRAEALKFNAAARHCH